MAIISENIMFKMRDKIINHLLSLPQSFYSKTPIGKLVTRTTNDVQATSELFVDVIIYATKDIISIIGIIIIMLIFILYFFI